MDAWGENAQVENWGKVTVQTKESSPKQVGTNTTWS